MLVHESTHMGTHIGVFICTGCNYGHVDHVVSGGAEAMSASHVEAKDASMRARVCLQCMICNSHDETPHW